MVGFRHKGDFSKTYKFLNNARDLDVRACLEKYGKAGVEALSSATPVDSGKTASSWYYEIRITKTGASLKFCNSNIQDGAPIAILLQYGHATRNGGWVEGRDYINPSIRPILDNIAKDAWREVTKS